MTEYSFVLRYFVPGDWRALEEFVERIGEAGVTDATVGIGRDGWLSLDFTREAVSAEDAVHGAMADVEKAAPTATLIQVVGVDYNPHPEPDTKFRYKELLLTPEDSAEQDRQVIEAMRKAGIDERRIERVFGTGRG